MGESNGIPSSQDFTMDKDNLYKEESFTDLKIGSIQVLTPVKVDGIRDENRSPVFLGRTQLNTPRGPIPIQVKLEAVSLEQAVDVYPSAMYAETSKVVARIRSLQEQQKKQETKPGVVPGLNN